MYSLNKVMQAQNINNGIEILGKVLGLAEKYALGKNIKYGYYTTPYVHGEKLLLSFKMAIEIFSLCYKKIKFPENLSKKEVLKEINIWKKHVPNENKIYYIYLSEILNDNYYDFPLGKNEFNINYNIYNIINKVRPLLKVDTFIKFEDYKNYFIYLHKKLSEFFDESYSNIKYDYQYKKIFLDYINSKDINEKSSIIEWVNRINSGTVQEFIQAYTGETTLCYSLNKWLRGCDENEFDKIKYFAGPFSYYLYQYAHNNPKMKVNFSKKFYRKMVLKKKDYLEYTNNIGELICYPAFTSTSEKDMTKYAFPTSLAIGINNIKSDDIYVELFIDYKCNNSYYPTPCINVSYYSSNSGEQEYIFPPFSFFRIERIETRSGKSEDPHIIYMTVPNKRILIEFAIKNNKNIYYNEILNELYSS